MPNIIGNALVYTPYDAVGDGSTTAFTLPVTPAADDNLRIFIDGIQNLVTTGWSRNGATVTFEVAPPNNKRIMFLVR